MLEAFSRIGSEDEVVRKKAGSDILLHVILNKSELDYAVKRLVLGLESNKVSTRTGSYATLATFLGLDKLTPTMLREIGSKTLVTDGQTTKKERRLIYIGRILASGVILRIVPFPKLVQNKELFQELLQDIVEMGQKRTTLLDLATPFITHVLEDKHMTKELFEEIVWPCMVPLFAKVEVKKEEEEEEDEWKEKGRSPALLQLALVCFDKGLKEDFEFVKDVKQVVKMLLSHHTPGDGMVGNLTQYLIKKELIEEFWTTLTSQMRSSHFETVCLCVQKSVEAGVHQNIIASDELVKPILGVFRDEEASEQHKLAVTTLGYLLKWDEEMRKKERKSVMKVLFKQSPNLLHEYQKTVPIINTFLSSVCTQKDLSVLESIVKKHLESDTNHSVRMSIVYLQFLGKLARLKKAGIDMKSAVGKYLLSMAFGNEQLQLRSQSEDGGGGVKEGEDDMTEANQQIMRCCTESFKSILVTTYNHQLLDEWLAVLLELLDTVCKEKDIRKLVKKARKRRKGTEDVHLKYLIGSYMLKVVLEQDHVLGEAQADLKELLDITVEEDAASKIVNFLLSRVLKDTQPPLDYQTLFSRLVIENKVKEDVMQQFAEMIDVEVNDEGEGDDNEEESSEDEEQDSDDDEDMAIEGEEDSNEAVQRKSKVKAKTLPKDMKMDDERDEGKEGSDSESSILLDEATEEDLESMDKALARVFATKKRMKEEDNTVTRTLLRTFHLLENLLSRNTKSCHISIPVMLLLPIVHSLQASLKGKKPSKALSNRIVSVLNRLNNIKKFEDFNCVEKGTLLAMAKDLIQLATNGKNKLIADLLGDSVVMLTRCYLQGNARSPGEDTGFMTMYTSLLDMKQEKRHKSMSFHSSVILSVLTSLPDWEEGKDEICKRVLIIIFDPKLRKFRRTQFLILLRTAFADKGNQTQVSKWKLSGIDNFTNQASKYLKTASAWDESMSNFTNELLSTFTDTIGNPQMEDIVPKYVKQICKDDKVRYHIHQFANKHPMFDKLLNEIGLSLKNDSALKEDTNAKSKSSKLTNGIEPEKLNKNKRKSEPGLKEAGIPFSKKKKFRKSLAY